MEKLNMENYDAEIKELFQNAPMDTKRIYVLDSSGEVDRVLDFTDATDVYKYFWAELHSVPVIIILKLKKLKRVHLRISKGEAIYGIKDGDVVLEEFKSVCSVTKSGLYSFLN